MDWLFESLPQAEAMAKATGKPVRLHTCCKGKSAFSALVVSAIIAGCSQSPEPTMLERYPGPWIEDFNVPITKVLASNNVKGCGQYKYRESSRDKGEYYVYCSADGKLWTAYIVWIPAEKMMGPYLPDPTITTK